MDFEERPRQNLLAAEVVADADTAATTAAAAETCGAVGLFGRAVEGIAVEGGQGWTCGGVFVVVRVGEATAGRDGGARIIVSGQ